MLDPSLVTHTRITHTTGQLLFTRCLVPEESFRTWNLFKRSNAPATHGRAHSANERNSFEEIPALVFLASIFRERVFVSFPPIDESRISAPRDFQSDTVRGTCSEYTGLLNLDEAVFTRTHPRHVSRKANASIYTTRTVVRMWPTKLFRRCIIVICNCTIDSFIEHRITAVIELNGQCCCLCHFWLIPKHLFRIRSGSLVHYCYRLRICVCHR